MSRIILFVCILLFPTSLIGQERSSYIVNDFESYEVPFEFENNFILVNIVLNGSIPLKFIFDTGAEYTIMTKKEIAMAMGVEFQKEVKLLGSDMSKELSAFISSPVDLSLGKVEARGQPFMVLNEDYYDFESYMGTNIHGILGANFFKNYKVKIDYKRRTITFYKHEYFKKRELRGFEKIPIEIERGKPYLTTTTILQSNKEVLTKYLIDTGASIELIVNTNTHPDLVLPAQTIRGNIGAGLGGHLEGYIGRIGQLKLGKYELNGVLTSFQEQTASIDSTYFNSRNGIIGNNVLNRFTVIIDYYKEEIHLKKNRGYNKKFIYDRSGLTLIGVGRKFSNIMVQSVLEGSPAWEAGLRKGDQVKLINGLAPDFLGINIMTNMLKKKEGKLIKMRIIREGKFMDYRFRLRDLI